MTPPEFTDRREAGRLLAAALRKYCGKDALVLALPRGGVPVGAEVARALGAELDIIVARKIGAPWHEEFGIGAVTDGREPELLIDEAAAGAAGATREYVREEARRQLAEVERRKLAYRGTRADPEVKDRIVIVVDDGVATGGTMKAALRALRRRRPSRLVAAVPVAPAEAVAELEPECDEIVCLATPAFFQAVGGHYRDFRQTSDEEVISLLAEARGFGPA